MCQMCCKRHGKKSQLKGGGEDESRETSVHVFYKTFGTVLLNFPKQKKPTLVANIQPLFGWEVDPVKRFAPKCLNFTAKLLVSRHVPPTHTHTQHSHAPNTHTLLHAC